MLHLDQRSLLIDSLRPPEGYRFDRGIGTTFTLDLFTLLIVPLSLTMRAVSDAPEALADPVLLLDGLRHYANRITIFCQAGRIAVPPRDNYLLRYLEEMVVQVQAPNGGVFHPKVWLLRYVAEGVPTLYRLLNLSRNLTFDRSWDLMLRMEGHLSDRQNAYSRNHPLGDFIEALPELATHTVSDAIKEAVATLQHEVRRVAFQRFWPFSEDFGFHPAGIPNYPGYRFPKWIGRALAISPFLSDRLLQRIAKDGGNHVLISRPESIAALKRRTRERYEKLYVLDDPTLSKEESDPIEDVGEEIPGTRPEPSGLHAKLFILESGWYATWLLGSANATNAAFWRKNVEFMVRLHGKRSQIGIDKVMGEDQAENQLGSLIRPFDPAEEPEPLDQAELDAEKLAGSVRDWLIGLGLHLAVQETDEDGYDLVLAQSTPAGPALDVGIRISCWPVGLRQDQGLIWESGQDRFSLCFASLSLLSLTPFIAFEIIAQVETKKHRLRFVLHLPISGLPTDRNDHLLRAIISDRGRFLRYLWLILGQDHETITPWDSLVASGDEGTEGAPIGHDTLPLLEVLVRALSRSPDKIDRVDQLVAGLRRTPEGQAILPEGFDTLWDAIMQTRKERL